MFLLELTCTHRQTSSSGLTLVLAEVDCFIRKNKCLGYTTREEFIRDVSRWRLKFLKEDFEYVEIPKKYERLDDAVKEMDTPFYSASDFIQSKVEEVLEQHDKWLQEKKST